MATCAESSLNCGRLHLTNGAGSMVTSSVRPLVVRVRTRKGPRVLDARRSHKPAWGTGLLAYDDVVQQTLLRRWREVPARNVGNPDGVDTEFR
jgi:hypothetical protein